MCYFCIILQIVQKIYKMYNVFHAGHGDTISREEPTLMEALKDKDIIDVECGGTYRYNLLSEFTIAEQIQCF